MNIARELKELGKLAPFSLLRRRLAGSRMRAAEGKLPGTLISAGRPWPPANFGSSITASCIGLAAGIVDEK